MVKLVIRFALFVALAAGVAWLADRPGSLTIDWLGYRVEEMPVAVAIVVIVAAFAVVWLAIWLVGWIVGRPGALGGLFRARRRRKGMMALNRGLVAVASGDGADARRQAQLARRILADQPLARLLDVEAARLCGDMSRLKLLYKEMLDDPEMEIVALRGLYDQARRAGEEAAARAFAERALKSNPQAGWASEAMLIHLAGEEDWPGVEDLIEHRRKAGLIDRERANRQRAVVLTAQALAIEDRDPQAAVDLAMRAHKLDDSLIPAAVVAGRLLNAQGALRKAARIIERTWRRNPHVDLGEVHGHARPGDSPHDRLRRVVELVGRSSGGEEGAVALAEAAIDAREWSQARQALSPFVGERPSARVCALMAEIEEGEHGDKGRAREWLARAVRAPRDPVWIADGYVSERWLPVSPVSGRLGAFEWKVPLAGIARTGSGEPVMLDSPSIDDNGPDETDEAVGETAQEAAAEIAGSTAGGGESEAASSGEGEVPEADRAGGPRPGKGTTTAPGQAAGRVAGKAAGDRPALRQPDDPGPEGEGVLP